MGFAIELMFRGTVLCLLAATILAVLTRAAAAYRHLICVLALCGLLTLPLVQQLLPPLPLHVAPLSALSERAAISHKEVARQTEASSTATPVVRPESIPFPRNAAFVAPAPAREGSVNTEVALFVVWAFGAVVLLVRLFAALRRLDRLKEESQEAMLGEIAIRVNEEVKTPLTWGVRRSVILLPAFLLSGDPAVGESALRHEQAHIARWDWAWNLFAEVVCALCWFQPGVWWLRSRMRRESERACDDRVLLSGIAAPDYAAHLVAILRSGSTSEVAPAMAHHGGMEERMKHILDTGKPRRAKRGWLAVSTPFALVLFSLAALRVSARPADASRQNKTGAAMNDVTKSDIAADEAPKPRPATPPVTINQAVSAKQTSTGAVAPQAAGPLNPVPLNDIVWGDAVDGLQAGFLLAGSGSPNHARVPLNSQVDFTVLVRNTTERALIFEVRHGEADPWNADPYVIPSDNIVDALRAHPLPDRFRARGSRSLALVPGAYYVQLAPGEAVVVPGKQGVYIGDGDRGVYPRIARVKAGMNWIVQPVTVRLLDTPEQEQFERIRKTPYSSKKEVTIFDRDGKRREVAFPLLGAKSGGKQLYARIQLEMGTLNAEAARNADGAAWGETEKGLQCGIRLLSPKRAFRIGDTLQAELLWRNTRSEPIKVFLPRKLDLYPSIHDASGKWREIAFGARFIIRPGSDTFEPGEVRSLGVIAVTLVAGGTPSPKSNAEPGHITLPPGSYKLSGSGGVGDPNPQSGTVGFKVMGAEKPQRAQEGGIAWGEKAGGIQLGARIAREGSVFKDGDTIMFQAFGRNLSGKDVDLSIGRHWKVNYEIQVQTLDGKPIDVKREGLYLPAGYSADLLHSGDTQKISEARLEIAPHLPQTAWSSDDKEFWVDTVLLKPGHHRVRLLSTGVFGGRKPMSGWIPIEVKNDARRGQAEEVRSEGKLVRDEQAARADVSKAQPSTTAPGA